MREVFSLTGGIMLENSGTGFMGAFSLISGGETACSGFSNRSSVRTPRRAGWGEVGKPTAARTCSTPEKGIEASWISESAFFPALFDLLVLQKS